MGKSRKTGEIACHAPKNYSIPEEVFTSLAFGEKGERLRAYQEAELSNLETFDKILGFIVRAARFEEDADCAQIILSRFEKEKIMGALAPEVKQRLANISESYRKSQERTVFVRGLIQNDDFWRDRINKMKPEQIKEIKADIAQAERENSGKDEDFDRRLRVVKKCVIDRKEPKIVAQEEGYVRPQTVNEILAKVLLNDGIGAISKTSFKKTSEQKDKKFWAEFEKRYPKRAITMDAKYIADIKAAYKDIFHRALSSQNARSLIERKIDANKRSKEMGSGHKL